MMKLFTNISRRIDEWSNAAPLTLSFSGVARSTWAQIFSSLLCRSDVSLSNTNHLILCPNLDIAEEFYAFLKDTLDDWTIQLFPGYESSPYSSIIPSEHALFARFKILKNISNHPSKTIIIATSESASLLNPPPELFANESFFISEEDIIGPKELALKLNDLGYSRSNTIEEPGTYASRGEIFDLYPLSDRPVRIQYYDELIEEIHPIDITTQRSNRNTRIPKIEISPTPHIITSQRYREVLRDNLPRPSLTNKALLENRKDLLSKLSRFELFDYYPFFLSLCTSSPLSLIDFTQNFGFVTTVLEGHSFSESCNNTYESLITDFDHYISDTESNIFKPNVSQLYDLDSPQKLDHIRRLIIDDIEVTHNLDNDLSSAVSLDIVSAKSYFRSLDFSASGQQKFIEHVFNLITEQFEHSGTIVFTTATPSAKSEIDFLIENRNFPRPLLSRIHFIQSKLPEGFYYPTEKTLIISDADLFAYKTSKAKKMPRTQHVDPFVEQIATLKINDYVIHAEHGIGKYIGLETLETAGLRADFLVIEYAKNDKIYTPVYKMNLISKHADSSSTVSVANLRSNKFAQLIERARNSAKKLAFDLIELEAQRRSYKSHSFSKPDHIFNDFELAFPFSETTDQAQAIANILDSMQKSVPMDHLVCGDVGFGKTEVAMRAAFLAVLDKKQVAILVPTTILALQHYLSFVKRFKDFPVNINFLSRFKTAKESTQIKEKLKTGHLDIIIGTHTLLSDSLKFKDLGLLVVDEEHRFGVNHKEKIKVFRSTIDCLTLSATPIPRTLQLAFMGLKELSLIQTPPPKRQSVKTYLVREDLHTLKVAIEKELNRGGQVFFVHNRVQTIDRVHQKIKEILPDATVVIAHGQLPERELENRMRDFYLGKYQILLCTTIIESGIDIPSANTIIIDRADCFGLAQLHQLRGRIGRSDKKAYAYFVIPSTITDVAKTRLQTLQTFSDIGSGFSIASSDLEIRGAGNILGAEQSGHVEAIGLELYMELIKEAVSDLKNEVTYTQQSLAINTPFPSYIPNSYISDSLERLKLYKKLSNCLSSDVLESYRSDLVDIYGVYPQEVTNLFTILEVRTLLLNRGILSINLAGKTVSLGFDKEFLDAHPPLRDKVLDFFLGKPKLFQLFPDYTVTYSAKENITPSTLCEFAKNIADQIVLC